MVGKVVCATIPTSPNYFSRRRKTKVGKHKVTRPSRRKKCKVAGCGLWVHGYGHCSKHYTRLARYGDVSITSCNVGTGKTVEERFWSKVNKDGPIQSHMDTQCWEWQRSPSERNHGVLSANKRRWMAHRFAWFLMTGKEPVLNLLHKCDNPPCVNPSHLYEGTQAQNVQDMMERGHCRTGSDRADAKLTDEQVREAYVLCQTKTPTQISKMFHVSRQLISNIKFGRSRRSALKLLGRA